MFHFFCPAFQKNKNFRELSKLEQTRRADCHYKSRGLAETQLRDASERHDINFGQNLTRNFAALMLFFLPRNWEIVY